MNTTSQQTLTLEEALRRATKGPLKPVGGYLDAPNGKTVADIRYMSGEETGQMDTLLLAHWYNLGPELVEALFDSANSLEQAAIDCKGHPTRHLYVAKAKKMWELHARASAVTLPA